MHKVRYVLHKVEWNSLETDIVPTKYNFKQYFQRENHMVLPALFKYPICIYTLQKSYAFILTDSHPMCVYVNMCRIVIYLKSKHLRHFIVNSLLIPSIGNFYSTIFKLKLFGKQYALNRADKRCVIYILANVVRSHTVSLKVLILLNKGYNILNSTKNLR